MSGARRYAIWGKAAAALLVWAIVVTAASNGAFELFDNGIEDLFWSLRHRLETTRDPARREGWKAALLAPDASSRVLVVSIGPETVRTFFESEGLTWPLPRRVYARCLKMLQELGVAAVGIDMVFGPGSPDDERELADAMRSASMPVILAASLEKRQAVTADGSGDDDEDEGYAFLEREKTVLHTSVPVLAEAARGLGLITYERGINQGDVIRKTPIAYPHEGRLMPSLSLAVWMAARGLREPPVLDGEELRLEDGTRFPQELLPASASVWNAPAAASPRWEADPAAVYAFRDLYDLYSGRLNLTGEQKAMLKGSMVLIGVSDDFLGDTISIPGRPVVAGIMLHAAMLDAMNRPRGFMGRLDQGARAWLPSLLLGLLCVWMLFAQTLSRPWLGALLALVGLCAVEGGAFLVFLQGWRLRTGVVIAGFPVALAVLAWLDYLFEGREKALIREAFGKQVSPEVVDVLIETPHRALEPTRQEISVCFIDVCGFTSFSEQHSPERVLVQLNYYFSRLVPIIHRHRGCLDKFIGDAMMITTGVPLPDKDHAFSMVRIALEIRQEISKINANLPSGIFPFTVSCGINSGAAILGNVGSTERMEYTVIGDTVNLASRLQGKAGSQEIVIGPKTYELVTGMVEVQPLEPLVVKGKTEPVHAWRVTGLKENESGG
ncbi:MAG TPA: adenylate/guanylate cyclase domain-containing protein [Candidatus Ozemobacteraceae bacterium]